MAYNGQHMLVLSCVILSLLAVINYRIGRAAFYPPFVFCAIWAVDLTIALAAGEFFYPLRAETLLLFVCGGLLFSLAGWIAFVWPVDKAPKPATPKSSQQIITRILALLVLGLPIYSYWVYHLASGIEAQSF